MYHFQNDYNAMCHPKVLKYINEFLDVRMLGYGGDIACQRAAAYICRMCGRDDLSVHFLTSGTQTNLVVTAALLRPHQAVIAAKSAHISEHETGAIEATGHKVIELDCFEGKITSAQIEKVISDHYSLNGPGPEHCPQPKMVYISFSTEFGTIYSLEELREIRRICDKYSLYLYVDGARLGYGLSAADCDVSICDLANVCDVFYIGGTKQGAMFGEAVVISNSDLAVDFRYIIKQRGAMIGKGWLIGLQFEALLQDNFYFEISERANRMADQIRDTLDGCGCEMPIRSRTNQIFVVLPDAVLAGLSDNFLFTEWCRVDSEHRMVRFCTSWVTAQDEVDILCSKLRELIL